jgi:asparagine synthase (glutamine-hydrolysing)
MCGIVAVVNRKRRAVPSTLIEAAADTLLHRGPDDMGLYASDHVAFGFRRLSIIDTSFAGHQPMNSADGTCTIVFNGEIYNYIELKAELSALGHSFRSTCDTEVLLAAYRQWGVECVKRFNGMWAFLIHDRQANVVFGARDRLGVKPLYLWQGDDWFVLASEPRAIGATGLVTLRPDWTRVADALVWNLMDHDNGTCFVGVQQIPAGSRFVITADGRYSNEAFWSLPDSDPSAAESTDDDQWIETLRGLVCDAVRLRQRSDVPIGFTLSGGIDSTMLICEAARLNGGQSSLLAFAYQDDAYDERAQVADTVAQTHARLVSINERDLDLSTILPALIRANGEPIHSMSAVANYALFGLARQHGVKVVIGGQGSDEAFAGYSHYELNHWLALLGDGRIKMRVDDVVASSRLRQKSATTVLLGVLRRAARLAVADTSLYGWARSKRGRELPRNAWSPLFSASLLDRASVLRQSRSDHDLEHAQRTALRRWPLPMYLRIEDRCSMTHSVEARLPFTDYRLVELAMRMPRRLKFSRGFNKLGLRKAATGRVPASVTAKPGKLGFPVTIGARAISDLRALGGDLVGSRSFVERGIYDVNQARHLLSATSKGATVEQADALFHLAQIETWLRDVADSPRPDSQEHTRPVQSVDSRSA